MKKVLSVILAIALIAAAIPFGAFAAGTETHSADDPSVAYIGRWVQQGSGVIRGSFNASLEVQFTGTSIGVSLSQLSGFVYQIDAGEWKFVSAATGSYTLATGLSAGTHTLKMAVSHHERFIYLNGFVLDEGASLLAPAARQSIEFIGDSITAGFIGANMDSDNIVSNTYGFIAAEKLGLYHDSVAVGGTGISKDLSGYGTISEIYARQTKEKGSAAWDTSKYQPDYIVVNLGTNDGDITNDQFKTDYKSFLSYLRTNYPNAKIVAMVPFNGAFRTTIERAVSEMNDNRIYYLSTLGWTEISETTDGTHLSKAAHQACGEYLAQALNNLITTGKVENADGSIVAPEFTGKYVYSDFSKPLAAGQDAAGADGLWLIANDRTTYDISNGALNITLPSGSLLRINKHVSNLARFRYMVVRVKDNGSNLGPDNTAFKLWFGSYSTGVTADLPVKASQIGSDYTDVVIELPQGYFDNVAVNYEGGLCIQSVTSATVSLSFDEIYFCNTLPTEEPPAEPVNKAYYSDFTYDFTNGPVPSGYGDNTISLNHNDGVDYTVSGGVLHAVIPQSKYLRFNNSMTDIDTFKYMIVRMRGSHNYPELSGNALKFWFGSYGTPGAALFMSVDQLTADYSDVVIEIPAGYFDSISADYKAGLFITSDRGATFTVDIDEIYFSNTLPGEEPPVEPPVDPPVEPANKAYYSDFTYDFSGGPVPSGYGDNKVSLFAAEGGIVYSVSGGALHMQVKADQYLRLNNTMTDIDTFKYMIVRMRGTYDWAELSGNTLKFWFGSYGTPGAALYVPVEQYTSEYTDVVIEIPAGYFDNIAADFRTNLFITTERGATFTVDIDEIYFSNTLPGEEPPVDPPVEPTEKAYYSDFTYDFTNGPVPSGYGDNTISLNHNDGVDYTVSGGVLHAVIPQGKYLRFNNSMTDIDTFKYMIVRMRGSHNYPELFGNALKFWFGSYGTPGAALFMSVDQLTADYSDVVIEIPAGYFDSISAEYKAGLFITSDRGATFTVDIDEIYFTNTLPGEKSDKVQIGGKTYGSLTEALKDYEVGGDPMVLLEDVTENVTVSSDVVLDLNGKTLTGNITVTGGAKLSGMDSTTDRYEVGTGKVVGEITEAGIRKTVRDEKTLKRYVAVQGEDGSWTFNRFYIGMKSISADVNSGDVGYTAVVGGNENVKAALADDAYGFAVWVEGYEGNKQEPALKKDAFVTGSAGSTLKLRVANQLSVINEMYVGGQTVEAAQLQAKSVCAQVTIHFADGTTETSAVYAFSIVEMYQNLDAGFDSFTPEQQASLKALAAKYPVMATWNLVNIVAD